MAKNIFNNLTIPRAIEKSRFAIVISERKVLTYVSSSKTKLLSKNKKVGQRLFPHQCNCNVLVMASFRQKRLSFFTRPRPYVCFIIAVNKTTTTNNVSDARNILKDSGDSLSI